MNDLYLKVRDLISRYCLLMKQENPEEEINEIGLQLSQFSNLRKEKYIIYCSRKISNYREIVYISYDNDFESLIDFANAMCFDTNYEGIEIIIYRTKNMEVVCKSSPLGVIFL